MQEYENLVEALVGMAKITRPKLDTNISPEIRRTITIRHGICDLLEDAAVAIDELMKRMNYEDRTHAEAA